MSRGSYEVLQHEDPTFPVIFHFDTVLEYRDFVPHWHESIELWLFTAGRATVHIDGTGISAQQGDMVVINSGSVHSIRADTQQVQYYCLIVDTALLEGMGLPVVPVRPLVRDGEAADCYRRIAAEFRREDAFQKAALRADITLLFVRLLRTHAAAVQQFRTAQDSRMDMVKSVIGLLRTEYAAPLSLTGLAQRVGFSRYYLCRIFREVTGLPVIKYLNLLRCTNARRLLVAGWTVGEAARACGFDNLSYFARTYKQMMGRLPSEEKRMASDVQMC